MAGKINAMVLKNRFSENGKIVEKKTLVWDGSYEIKDYLKTHGYTWDPNEMGWWKVYDNLLDELTDVIVDNNLNPEIAAKCVSDAYGAKLWKEEEVSSPEKQQKLAAYMQFVAGLKK